MSNTNTADDKVLSAIRGSKGRFFGIYTKQGEVINSQLSSESKAYMVVYDRNNDQYRRLAKTSLVGVRISGQTIGTSF
jgi:hypothetical protein